MLSLAVILLGAGCAKVVPLKQAPQDASTNAVQEDQNGDVQQVEIANGLYQLDAMTSQIQWKSSEVKLTNNGTVTAREGSVRLLDGQPVDGSVLVDMITMKNQNLRGAWLTQFENHMRSADFFDVKQYPTASFTVKHLEPLSGITGSNYRVDGEMTIKNVTKSLSFPANIKKTETGLNLVGHAVIDRTLYGIQFRSAKFFENLGDKMIDDDFYLDLDLMFTGPVAEEATISQNSAETNEDISEEIKGS